MTESDFYYILHRLGYSADQPVSKALRQVLLSGDPYGPSARAYRVPAYRLASAIEQAREIERHFTVTADESLGLSPNELLAYVRRREAPPPEPSRVVTAAQLRAAGVSEDQIKEILKCE